ncbi:MAG: hypothetical protein ACR2OV_11790 [Hyphomicrobiaceae bacterium]
MTAQERGAQFYIEKGVSISTLLTVLVFGYYGMQKFNKIDAVDSRVAAIEKVLPPHFPPIAYLERMVRIEGELESYIKHDSKETDEIKRDVREILMMLRKHRSETH